VGLKENNGVFFRSLTKKINSAVDNHAFLNIGKIVRAYGLKGEVFVSLAAPAEGTPLIVINQVVQIRKNCGNYLDTLVQEARSYKKGMIVRLDRVTDRQQAESLNGAFFYVPRRLFSSLKGENMYLCEVLNFEVCDKNHGAIGTVFAFSDNGVQDLLLVQGTHSTPVEIPFTEVFVTDIDFDLERIQVDLPLGWPGLEYLFQINISDKQKD